MHTLLYKHLKGKTRIPTDDLIPKNMRCRNQVSVAFQILSASTYTYKRSFFNQIIRDWNDLPGSLVISAEMPDDCDHMFTSLVRDRDKFSLVYAPVAILSFCRFAS